MKSSRHGGSFLGFLATLTVGALLGAGAYYFATKHATSQPQAPLVEPTPAPVASAPVSPAVEPEHEDYISRKLREWNLTPDELKRELANARDVVREKGRAFGENMKVATADVTIVAKIKAKYTLDDQLSALALIVDCREGHVKLSGTVATPDLIGRAIVLALDTDGVLDVVSSIKVEHKPEPA